MLIDVDLPENVSTEKSHYFLSRTPYKLRRPKIKLFKSVFVSHEGLVLKNGLLVRGCAFNLLGKQDNTFYWPFWKLSLEQYVVSKWGKSLPSLHLKGPSNYLLIHSKWFNYAFWVTDYLRRLIHAKDEGFLKKTILIVPEGWKNIPYAWESLKAFEVQMEIIPAGYHLFVENLIMPETREWTSSFDPEQLQTVRDRMTKIAYEKIGRRYIDNMHIYLTRKKRGLRSVENEEDVISLLKKFDYNIVQFEDLSFWEQVVLMNNSTSFISIHGAGFSNMAFMKKGSCVLELINEPYAKSEYTFPFWKQARALGLNYLAQFCSIKDKEDKLLTDFGKGVIVDENKFLVNQNIVVDTVELKKNLEIMHK